MHFDKTLAGLGGSLLVALSLGAVRPAEAAPLTPPTNAPSQPPAALAPAPVAAGESPRASAQPLDGPTYAVHLRDLEQRIAELSEQIRRNRARISLLSESILGGGGADSRTTIKFTSDLSGAFRVTRLRVILDGTVQYSGADPAGGQAERFELPVFNGLVPPGDHTVQVLVNLEGDGYGVFTYLRGYRFEVRSSHSFTTIEGKTTRVEVTSYEKGVTTTPFEDRPALRYGEKTVPGLDDTTAQPPPR